ncbi:hypothetical protein JRO89_XS04G0125900 [Xanthoceras sorbifolium]|uniref:DUF4219 domain-containing protein n=1 Tax=Xanthoceras sorbifolium TaxID=99658 RepID=A0ABQ8I539_9ROSI|nr:hypothetical protein JRO89_XS04G0125900 [Xanthoceras sorbifolium]
MQLRDGVSCNSLISGLAQSGYSDRASELFEKMLLDCLKPDRVTVASLLIACASAGTLHKEEQLHSYAIKVRMSKGIIIEEPGQSWIEVKNSVHAFFVGDPLHPLADSIYKFLENLNERAAKISYVPSCYSLSNNIEQEQKDRTVVFLHVEIIGKMKVCKGDWGLIGTWCLYFVLLRKLGRFSNGCSAILLKFICFFLSFKRWYQIIVLEGYMASSNNSGLAVPQFSGENYQIWTVKMKSYLKSFGLWEHVEQEKQDPPLRANPTIAQIKQHEEEKMKKNKAVTCLERVKTVKLLTLKREFEMLKMKEGESVKDYSSKLSQLVNQMRLYSEVVEESKVVEKMLIGLPDKFEAKVSAIEESCDLKNMTISEMVSKLQA